MARRVRLHIGTMKSATTYLQALCEAHLDKLAAAGVLWPAGELRYAAIRDLLGRAQPLTDPPDAWHTLQVASAAHHGDVLLSDELLAGLGDAEVARVVAGFAPAEVSVVITARDPARVIPSAWQTAVKSGQTTVGWAAYAATVCSDRDPEQADTPDGAPTLHERFWRQHDVAELVRRWGGTVPLDRIVVVTVPPSGGDRDAVARRFGAAVGVDLSGLPQPRIRGNSTLGAYSAELVRRVHLALPDADEAVRKYGVRTGLAVASLGSRAGQEPTFGLSSDQFAWARRQADRVVGRLREDGVRVEGDLADLLPVGGPAADDVDPGAATDAQLLEVAIVGLAGLARYATRQRLKARGVRRAPATPPPDPAVGGRLRSVLRRIRRR